MQKKTVILLYFLSAYVIIQFVWWGLHILDLTEQLMGDTPKGSRKMWMIIGEGTVFLGILGVGMIKIKRNIQKELDFSRNQNNFLLSVTHELKTPIASTKLYLQTLKKHQLEDQKRGEIIEKTLLQNQQLERLIDNLLNATRLEGKRLVLHREETNVSTFLISIVDRYAKQYPSIVFYHEIQNDIVESIDPFIFETVVNNLIENAIKYAGNEAEISVCLHLKDKLFIRIKDNGPGVPTQYQKDIFKKFYRIGNEETRMQKGSGIGLFISKELSRLHKGDLKYFDNQPKGAVFEFSLGI